MQLDPQKKIFAEFFKTFAGNEPVREILHKLGRPTKTQVGEDVRFVVYENRMVLVHFFQKKARKTPASEIDVAWDRMKQWVREERKGKK